MRYRVIQDGMPVAWATGEREILHYAAIYGQDGPVAIEERPEKGRWRKYVTPS
jgi:hypothetical protein